MRLLTGLRLVGDNSKRRIIETASSTLALTPLLNTKRSHRSEPALWPFAPRVTPAGKRMCVCVWDYPQKGFSLQEDRQLQRQWFGTATRGSEHGGTVAWEKTEGWMVGWFNRPDLCLSQSCLAWSPKRKRPNNRRSCRFSRWWSPSDARRRASTQCSPLLGRLRSRGKPRDCSDWQLFGVRLAYCNVTFSGRPTEQACELWRRTSVSFFFFFKCWLNAIEGENMEQRRCVEGDSKESSRMGKRKIDWTYPY